MRIGLGRALVVALAACYGIFHRVLDPALVDGTAPGVWDVILGVALMPYFFTYVALPAWIVATVVGNRRLLSYPRLLRLGSRFRTWRSALADAARLYVTSAAAVIAAWLIVSIGLEAGTRVPADPVMLELARHGIPPIIVLAAQMLVNGIALLVVSAILLALRLVVGTAVVEVVVGTGLFVWAALSSTGALGSGLGNSAMFSSAAAVIARPGMGLRALAALTLIVVLAASAVLLRDRRDRTGDLGLVRPGRVAAALACLLLVVVVATAEPERADLVGVSTEVLYGSGAALVQYLLPALIAVGYAVMLVVRLPPARGPLATVRMLRDGSRIHWAMRMLRQELLVTVAISGGVFVTLGTTYLIAGGTELASDPARLGPWVMQSTLNAALQLMVYAAFVVLLQLAGLSRTAQVVGVSALIPAGAYLAPELAWVPIGASALGRALAGWPCVLTVTAGLAGSLAVLTAVILVLGSHRKWSW
jgi:hypothetical protein